MYKYIYLASYCTWRKFWQINWKQV